ncbi:MAG: histidine--tRNA ligase [Candidatus Yonathbacteria bacterium RIFCSPLOWO2_01_FULL_47_33b]|uniref:Histidine--tRNA ligase n=1 Tax=Candidatus Yonathbacteria bacterium RIFCSPLOWO2_01_FULL_47_33b TaxID=1802727 RepID=A0A1G2SEC7_9BACT|nr:MAG: histidine--tRNA ligase [Candidatus Yonathbacteria bacterium RIFCSPLOWO2_01_FULL_47_33b]
MTTEKPEKAKKLKSEDIASPKGMRDLMEKEYYAYQGFFEKASDVAIYYGFRPIETPILEREAVFTSSLGVGTDIRDKEMYVLKTKGGDHLAMRPEGTAAVMRAYIENGMQALPQPVMLYYYGPYFRHENPQRGRLREFRQFGFEILGSSKSIMDALVIRSMTLVLEEAGFKNLSVEINSIGDKECRSGYIRELTNYYKKHVNELCPHCKERIKTNPLRLLDCKDERCQGPKAEAPTPIDSLCNDCRHHFKEVIEYLEAMSIPYHINNNLVRGLDYYTRTVFEILDLGNPGTETSEPVTIASGGRYDLLAHALGSKKEVPGVGGGIGVDRVLMSPSHKQLDPRIIKKPKVYFIQLGSDARLKSLTIIETLRKARIPLAQSLSKDGLGQQLAIAERMGVPYTIIFGQKEALDNTVIVRNMETRSQETVTLANLPDFVKHLKEELK